MTTEESKAGIVGGVGVVVIGRNEGERLKRCLRSLEGSADRLVYVDSGSTDGSVDFARSIGVDVVELDMGTPFTMARGRNAGFARLLEVEPGVERVQFIDGDCEAREGWMEAALAAMAERDDVAAVCGRRRERAPEASVYNRLTDLEWSGEPGEVAACGGDALMRVAALREMEPDVEGEKLLGGVGGVGAGPFNPRLIAGEEPELCFRLRLRGWKILRIDEEMTLHDAAMTRFSQWWRRTVRAGHAYAECAWMHRLSRGVGDGGGVQTRGGFRRRDAVRALLWGLAAPVAAVAGVALAFFLSPWFAAVPVLAVLAFVALWAKVFLASLRRREWSGGDALVYACACVAAKPAQALGAVIFFCRRLLGKEPKLIEYKDPAGSEQRA